VRISARSVFRRDFAHGYTDRVGRLLIKTVSARFVADPITGEKNTRNEHFGKIVLTNA
jgi:hypothetical protein